RVLLERLLEALERTLQPVLLEVAEAQLEDGLLRLRRKAPRLLELLDGPRELAGLAQDVAEQDVGRGHGRGLERPHEGPLRVLPPREVGIERPEREVREERIGLAVDRALQRGLRGARVSALGRGDPPG